MESLQPVNAAPPDLRDEMCGPHRKRPAAEEADDETERRRASCCPTCRRSAGKASALLKERPDAVKAIVVFLGAAKSAAEKQFADARAKIQKLAKGKNSETTPGHSRDSAASATDTKATTPALQTVSSPPSGAFTPTSGQPQRALRALPTATDVHNPSAMSYAPAKIEPAPLTAVPDAKPAVRLPLQRRSPRRSPRPNLPPQPSPTQQPSPPAAAKTSCRGQTRCDAKQAATAKPATASKQAARKQDASTKQ